MMQAIKTIYKKKKNKQTNSTKRKFKEVAKIANQFVSS